MHTNSLSRFVVTAAIFVIEIDDVFDANITWSSVKSERSLNIFNFKSDYPDHKVFKLEQNYRSTQHIVKAANSLIDYNQDQIKKNVFEDTKLLKTILAG